MVTKKRKKKLKTTRKWYFTHLPGRPRWGDRFEFCLAGPYRRRNHPCQILWQSVQGFWSSDTPNFALLYRNSWSPLQQCKHYRATLWWSTCMIFNYCVHRSTVSARLCLVVLFCCHMSDDHTDVLFERIKMMMMLMMLVQYRWEGVDVDVDGVCERRPKPLCPHLEITSR